MYGYPYLAKTLFKDFVFTTTSSIRIGAKLGLFIFLGLMAFNVLSFVLLILMGQDPFNPYLSLNETIDTLTPASLDMRALDTDYPDGESFFAGALALDGEDVQS